MRVTLSGVLALSLFSSALGQVARPDQETRAIVGARIVVAPGKVIENGTVVIRNGLIAAVGEAVQAPVGAEVVPGKGLTVYAGFIDMGTTRGLRTPPAPPLREDLLNRSEDVPTAMRGTWPSSHADWHGATLFDPEDTVWRSYRSAGFTSALVMPQEGVFRGTAALVNLGARGLRESVIVSEAAVVARLLGVRDNAYPSSELGAYALVRQTLMDVQWASRQRSSFGTGGSNRPMHDPGYAVLEAALHRRIPMIFEADQESRIDRALAFSQEFKVRPMILGGLKAHRTTDQLKAADVAVIVGLNFNREPASRRQGTDEPHMPDDPIDVDLPELIQERQRVYREDIGNAAMLEKAGIPFAFTTRATRDFREFMANLRRAVGAGLSREGALAALTLNPARMLNLERQLGTIEVGKIANLSVMTGDFLDEKTTVRYVFIDGRRLDPSRAPQGAREQPQQEDHIGR